MLLLANIAMKLEKQEADVQCIGCERCERCETHRLVLVCFGCKRDDGTSISTTGCPESVARRKRGRWRMAEANACEPSYLPGVRRERRRGRDGIEGNVGDDTETRGKWRLLGVSLLRPGRIEPSAFLPCGSACAPPPWTTLFKPKKRQQRSSIPCTQTFSTSD